MRKKITKINNNNNNKKSSEIHAEEDIQILGMFSRTGAEVKGTGIRFRRDSLMLGESNETRLNTEA